MASNPPTSGPGQPWPGGSDTPPTGQPTGNPPQPGQWPPPAAPSQWAQPASAQPSQWGQGAPQTQGQWPPPPPPAARQPQPSQQWGQQPQGQPGQWPPPGQQPPNQWAQPQQPPNQWAQPQQPPNQWAQPQQPPNQWGQPAPQQWGQQPPPPPNQWAPPVAQYGWAEFDPEVAASDYPVDVRFTPEARIGRFWGIPLVGFLIRAIALIPHLILLYVLGVVAVLLSLVTWIPVLITGRYPGWGYTIVGGYLRWGIRVGTWLYLLSGTYPPFSGGQVEGQHVRVRIDEDRPIGRFWGIPIVGILVRVIILIPHFIVLYLLGIVAWVLILFSWIPVLVNGRQADLVYTVVGGYVRWITRVYAYLLLMSGPYPPFRLD